MDYIINKIMCNIKENGNYDEEQTEIIRYGLELLLLKIIFTIGALSIGAVMGCFVNCVVFLIAFSCLRTLAGGYHANTRFMCALESSGLLIGCLLGMRYAGVYTGMEYMLDITAVIAAVVVWKYGPVDCENKRLEPEESVTIRKKMRRCLCTEGVLGVLSAVLRVKIISTGIACAVFAAGVLMIVEKMVEHSYVKEA